MQSIFLLAYIAIFVFLILAVLVGCHLFCFVETDQRNQDKAKQKEETALLQEEQRKLAKNVDELKDQLERQTTTLHSQVVAAQS